ALTTSHQEPLTFGGSCQDCLRNHPLLLAGRAREIQRGQLLLRSLDGVRRASLHALNFQSCLKWPTEPGTIQYMQGRHSGFLDKGQFGQPVQPPLSIFRSIDRHEYIHVTHPFVRGSCSVRRLRYGRLIVGGTQKKVQEWVRSSWNRVCQGVTLLLYNSP